MAIEIGTDAPDFSLKDQNGDVVTLSSFEGQSPVAVVFYPFTFTGVCEGELCTLRDDFSEFEAAGVQVLAISCDSRFAQAKWAEEQGFALPGPVGLLAARRGWPRPTACSTTPSAAPTVGTFVIDVNGKVVDAFESPDLGPLARRTATSRGPRQALAWSRPVGRPVGQSLRITVTTLP